MKCAYVTLVMCGETYVQGALVLAQSLKNAGSTAERVVMVTNDVGQLAREVLAQLFTKVVVVEDLAVEVQQRHQPRFSNTHYVKQGPDSWLRKIFTKFHMFGLVEYDLICWLDADMYALSSPDSLFDLRAPAGVCSYYRWEDDAALHGRAVPQDVVEKSLTVPTGHHSAEGVNMPYGIRGAVSLLRPSEDIKRRIFEDLSGMEEYGDRRLVVGPDEMYLTRFFLKEWTHVHHKYACPAWKTDEFRQRTGEEPVMLHFVTDKPWGARCWPDFDQWRATAKQVMDGHSDSTAFFSDSVLRSVGRVSSGHSAEAGPAAQPGNKWVPPHRRPGAKRNPEVLHTKHARGGQAATSGSGQSGWSGGHQADTHVSLASQGTRADATGHRW